MDSTYKIIGADGREYGPIPLDEIKRWIGEGRVAGSTHVWCDDRGAWAPASSFEELQPHLPALPSPPPLATSTTVFESVGFWMRFGAWIIDFILVYVALSLLVVPLISTRATQVLQRAQTVIVPGNLPETEEMWSLMVSLLTILIVLLGGYALISLCYYVLMNGRYGATLGKLAIGAKIVRLDGSPINYGLAFKRYSAEIVCFLTLGFGYLMAAFREDKRGLHDLIAKTRVIYRR